MESIGTKIDVVMDTRKQVEERALEKEEEDYFNENSDEEDTASASMSHNQRVQAHPVSSNGFAPSCTTLSSRPGALVDYDDDEDDEDYKPPPRRQIDTSDGDEGSLESFSAKRKLAAEEEHGLVRKQRLHKNCKSKESVFVALCSTLSQAVLPNKSAASIIAHNSSDNSNPARTLDENNHQESKNVARNNSDENENGEKAAPQSYLDESSTSQENGHLDEHPHLPSKSSLEMMLNGS